MYKHILVPLDGSNLAENALPAAVYLAEKLGSQVTLLHVIEENAPANIHGDKHLNDAEEAQTYLKALATRFGKKIEVQTHVHREQIENVARSIVTHAQQEFAPDLIVMCAHGSGGLRDIFLGNIAQQVLSASQIPVLLIDVQEQGCGSCFELKTILLPLDGQPEHERAISTGKELALRCHATIILLMVIPTRSSLKGERAATGLFLPGAMNAALEQAEGEAGTYLQEHLIPFSEAGIPARALVMRGDPAAEIANTAASSDIDLIILGTHARVGSQAFWASSVAARVSTHTHKPILFIPVK